jgi:predicted nucleic acid-binding Zn ribbon protein
MTTFLLLHPAFLFLPVTALRYCEGWLCGTFVASETLPHRQLLAKGSLARRHHRRPLKGEQIAEIEITESEVENSFLWHENLGAALEAQRVLFETEAMDEQQYCDPKALVDGDRAKSALVEFINLELGNTNHAISFIKKFGAFDIFDGNIEVSPPREVQQFCNDCLNTRDPYERRHPYAIPLSQFWDTQQDILGLWNFADSLSKKKQHAVREECKRRRPTVEFSGEPDWFAIGKAVLSADLSASLNASAPKPPRLLLHDRDGRFIAMTLCRTVRSALYVQLLTAIVSVKEHRRCSHCSGYFIPRVQSQTYCGGRCQNVAKVRRSRDKKTNNNRYRLMKKHI